MTQASTGVDAPNYTQAPNIIFDEWMADMECTEFKVVMAIVRFTFGWHKERDRISLSQLEAMTGLSRQGVSDGIKAALKRGAIDRQPCGQGFTYALLVNSVDQSSGDTSTQLTSTSQLSRPALVNSVDTQKKVNKAKDKDSGADAPEDDPEDWLTLTIPKFKKAVKAGKIDKDDWQSLLDRERARPKPRKGIVKYLDRLLNPVECKRNPLFDVVCKRVYYIEPGSADEDDVSGRVGNSLKSLRNVGATLFEFVAACDWYDAQNLNPPRDLNTGQLIRDYRASHSETQPAPAKTYWSGQSRDDLITQMEQTPA